MGIRKEDDFSSCFDCRWAVSLGRFLGGVALALSLLGCQADDLKLELASPTSLSGNVQGWSGLSSSGMPQSICGSFPVRLYEIESDGFTEHLLSEASIDSTGNFNFTGLLSVGFQAKTSSTRYILRYECGNTSVSRFVTGTENQVLSEGTSIFSWIQGTSAASKIYRLDKSFWPSFFSLVDGTESSTLAYSTLLADEVLRTRFESTFGLSAGVLAQAAPRLLSTRVGMSMHEREVSVLNVQAVHWSADYQIAYSWRIGSRILGHTANLSYAPNANEQGVHTLQLYVGRDNGHGEVDTSKAYLQRSFTVQIDDNFPATPPLATLVSSSPTSAASVTLRLQTGSLADGRPQNCESFSQMAIVEEAAPGTGLAPLNPSSYTLECTQAGTQDVTFNLEGTEGSRVLRLWARDSSGNISMASRNLAVLVDRTPPSVILTSPTSSQILRGGETRAISWILTEANPTAHPIKLEYSLDDGSNWSLIADNLADSGSANWTVPSVNSMAVRLRVSAQDIAGQTGFATSASALTIDSVAPSAPTLAITGSSLKNSRDITLAIGCLAEHAQILIRESSSPPSLNDSGWTSCSTTAAFQLSSSEGSKTLYLWAADAAGNISGSASTTSVTLDLTPPSLSFTAAPGGFYAGGTTWTLQWTVTETHISSAENFVVEYSTDAGASWQGPLATVASTAGPLNATSFSRSITWPAVDSAQFKLRVRIADLAGNDGAVVSTAFTVDSQKPVISGFVINGGAGAAGSYLPLSASVSDSGASATGVSSYRLSLNSSFSGAIWQTGSFPVAFNFPFASGTIPYTLYAQVRDGAGNVSDTAQATVTISIGRPPTVVLIQPSSGSTFSTSGQVVHFAWKGTVGGNPLASSGLQIKWTLNKGLSSTPWPGGESLNPVDTGTCTTADLNAGATGCADLSLPADLVSPQIFQVVVSVTDSIGNSGLALSSKLNVSGLQLLAGIDASAVGGSALSTSLSLNSGNNFTSLLGRDPGNGDIYFAQGCALMKISGVTGNISLWAGEPTSCTDSGDNSGAGIALSQLRFSAVVAGRGNRIVFDSSRNIYWPTTAGIWKYERATNKAFIYVGKVNSPYSLADGTHRLSLNTSTLSALLMSDDDTLYFFAPSAASGLFYLYRVEGDRIRFIAGNPSGLTSLPSEGGSSTTLNVGSYTIIPGATRSQDRILVFHWGWSGTTSNGVSGYGIWEVQADPSFPSGKISLLKPFSGAAYQGSIAWLRSRSRLAVNFSGNSSFGINFMDLAAAPFTSSPYGNFSSEFLPAYMGGGIAMMASIVDDENGGFFFSGGQSTIISYVNAANQRSDFAGRVPGGDGGPATLALLRTPNEVVVDSSSNIYINDDGDFKMRKVSGGTISTPTSPVGYSSNYLSLVDNEVLVSTDNGSPGQRASLYKVSNSTCLYLCGNSSAPWVATQTSMPDGHTFSTLTGITTGAGVYQSRLTRDPSDGSYYYAMSPYLTVGSGGMGLIARITNSGDFSIVSGAFANGYQTGNPVSLVLYPNTTVNATATQISSITHFSASNGIISAFVNYPYGMSGSVKGIYTLDLNQTTPKWVRQVNVSTGGMAVDATNNAIFYINSSLELRKKVYAVNGAGADTLVASLNGIFTAPVLRGFYPGISHSVVIVDGAQIFAYTHSSLP